jgi:electron transfer flavoprotein alpha subunit
MSKILVLADAHAITAAKLLSEDIDVLVCGDHASAECMAKIAGVKKVFFTDDLLYLHGQAENSAVLIQSLSKQYDIIMGVANTCMKNILPRVSGLTNWPMLADVIEIKNNNTFVRPIYAGNALQTIQMHASKFILTVRSANFEACEETQNPAVIEKLDVKFNTQKSKFIKQESSETSRPDLSSAKIVVSGGRGLQQKENFALIEKLADTLHAAVGASRAAVDAGWVPNDYQVGQTGKIVAPNLYIAIGISGAIQHIAGMKDSKVIVAINKDPDAPIFNIADYGLVADLFEALPQLEKALHE